MFYNFFKLSRLTHEHLICPRQICKDLFILILFSCQILKNRRSNINYFIRNYCCEKITDSVIWLLDLCGDWL